MQFDIKFDNFTPEAEFVVGWLQSMGSLNNTFFAISLHMQFQLTDLYNTTTDFFFSSLHDRLFKVQPIIDLGPHESIRVPPQF